jgi:hypothetical protein
MRRLSVSTLLVIALAMLQVAFAWSIRTLDPKRDYLAPPPSAATEAALAFGDPQFLFRIFALDVQNAGDTGGRVVPVKNYDFDRVIGWLEALTRLDPRSDFPIGMAGGYFGLSQDVKDVAPIVRFMMRNVDASPRTRWKLLYDAIYLARHRLKDDDLGLEAARQMASYDFDEVDPWAAFTPAFILEDLGRYEEAQAEVRDALGRVGLRMTERDRSWIDAYLGFLAEVAAGRTPPRRRTWQP